MLSAAAGAPAGTSLLSAAQVAKALELTAKDAGAVMAAGIAGELFTSSMGTLVRAEAVAELAARPWVSGPHAAALVLRVGPQVPELNPEHERTFVGWHQDAPDLDGVRGLWSLRNVDDLVAARTLTLVSCKAFICAAFLVVGYTRIAGKIRFETAPAGDLALPFLGHRLSSGQGPVAVRIAAADGR